MSSLQALFSAACAAPADAAPQRLVRTVREEPAPVSPRRRRQGPFAAGKHRKKARCKMHNFFSFRL